MTLKKTVLSPSALSSLFDPTQRKDEMNLSRSYSNSVSIGLILGGGDFSTPSSLALDSGDRWLRQH
ncbi:hypothetical protein F2Q69_00049764 [Brassica cretica]|uniref:Uncharacterized protein n=1 Tax=Brassica cretica TaxID=69181 RepID=A0A8S9PUE7_BRACR|nr:hypothetical protein F2Q69_00049764 [Brassica cretica]